MRLLVLTLTTLLSLLTVPAFGAERILFEWDFSKATDTLGWTQAEPIKEFKVEEGALIAVAGPGRPKLASPLFELKVSPWQYVEAELKTDLDGHALLYYSNTTEPPYGGFRPQIYTVFSVTGDNQWRKYTIRPFWQKQGKIVHIRLDPPGNNVAVRVVRIIDAKPNYLTYVPLQRDGEGGVTSWKFKNTDYGWQVFGPAGTIELMPKYLKITGDQNTYVLSPPLDLNSDDNLWATVRIAWDTRDPSCPPEIAGATAGTGVALFRWVSDESDGLHSIPIVLKGDGLVRTYAIDLGDVSEWSGTILAVGITPTDGDESRSILVESVALSNKPVGPPELEITRFGLDYPIVRVGQKAKVIVETKNVGGSEALSVTGAVTLVDKGTHNTATLLPKRVASLVPGQTARFEWEIEAKDEREKLLVCRVNGLGLDAGEKSINVKFWPKLKPLKSAAYVPEPVKADTGKYLIGCYYFPGWHTYDRWAVLENYPERRPLLGWYREGDPEVADWHINWALSHGIGFFIYDWYWDRGNRQLEHALHDGFLKSRYQDKMRFCLLWANHNPKNTSSEEDCLAVTRYWIENYFRLPNYLKVNGKPVVVIFSTDRLTQDMGSDAVRSTFDKMRRICEESGVGGLYLIGCTYPGKERIETLLREGYDALSGYNYPSAGNRGQKIAPYEWMVEGYKDFWNQIADAAIIPYIPVCEPGWDARPWHGRDSFFRTGKSPDLWRQMLENAKAFVDDPKHKQDGEKKLVFLEAWNEFGEGDYIEPHAEFGFDYLEAIRQVFAPQSNKPEIVVPPDLGLGPYDIPKPEARTSWDFSDPRCRDWQAGNMTGLSYEGGVMSAVAHNNDPAFYSPWIDVDASKFKTIEIKMRIDKGPPPPTGGDNWVIGQAQLFFTGHQGKITEKKSVKFEVIADNEWRTYTLDMSQNKRWRDRVGQIRLDPIDTAGAKVEVAYVKFK